MTHSIKYLICLLVLAFALPVAAATEHWDVLETKLKDNCTVEKFRSLTTQFNDQWGKEHGYLAQVAVPIQSEELGLVFWIGHTANAAAYGAAWDAWRDEITDSRSVAGRLNKAFDDCRENVARRGFDIY